MGVNVQYTIELSSSDAQTLTNTLKQVTATEFTNHLNQGLTDAGVTDITIAVNAVETPTSAPTPSSAPAPSPAEVQQEDTGGAGPVGKVGGVAMATMMWLLSA